MLRIRTFKALYEHNTVASGYFEKNGDQELNLLIVLIQIDPDYHL